MELGKFIESDIVAFLNKVAESTKEESSRILRDEEIADYSFTRDYAKEAKNALADGDLELSRQIFLKFRAKAEKYPEKSAEQKKAYSIMAEIKNEIQEYLNSVSQYEKISRKPEDMGISLPDWDIKIEIKKPDEVSEKEEEDKDNLAKEIRNNIEKVYDLLSKEDIVTAVLVYRKTKALFEKIPEEFKKEKSELHNNLLAAYQKIKITEKKLKEKGYSSVKENSRAEKGKDKNKSEKAFEKKEPEIFLEKSNDDSAIAKDSKDIENEQGNEETKNKEIKSDILLKLEKFKDCIRKKKPREAYSIYKEIKELFGELESPEDVKEELFKDILASYTSFRNLEMHLVNRKQRHRSAEPLIKEASEPDFLEKIRKEKLKIYSYLDHNEIKSAMIQYNKLRSLYEKIPLNMKDEKNRLHSELAGMHEQILEKISAHEVSYMDEVGLIKQLADKGSLQEAQHKFLDLQHKIIGINNEKERKSLYFAMDKLRSRLHLAKAAESMEKRLVKA